MGKRKRRRGAGTCDITETTLGYYNEDAFMTSCCEAISTESSFCPKCGRPSDFGWHRKSAKKSDVALKVIWCDDEDGMLCKCTGCKKEFTTAWFKPKWCPACGAPFSVGQCEKSA